MKKFTIFITIIFTILILACNNITDDDYKSLKDILKSNREKWESKNINDYNIRMNINEPDKSEYDNYDSHYGNIYIRDGDLTSDSIKNFNSEVDENIKERNLLTIPQYFNEIEKSIDNKYEIIDVNFENYYGYPKMIKLFKKVNDIENFIYIDIINFTNLSPSPTP